MRPLDLGFVALTDAAPLIVAKEHGLFSAEGVDVTLHREVSWATIRDKVAAGMFHGAHMLAPMVIAARMGAGAERASLVAPMSLNAHGASIGVSSALAAEMGGDEPADLSRAAARRAGRSEPAITFAVVFAYSMHNYMLRYWAASAGLDPDRDIRIVIAPPTGMVERLKSGEIDGFCVGAPWGAVCEAECGARIVLEASDFWPGGPDKVLCVSERWSEEEPEGLQAVMRAVLRAAAWADAPENALALADCLSAPNYLATPPSIIARRLAGAGRIRFAQNSAAFPWRSHAAWIAGQMLRWGQVPPRSDPREAMACYRPDLFRSAAAAVGLSAPRVDSKSEGAQDGPWLLEGSAGQIPMSRDLFFDHQPFDPDSVRDYAAGFAVTRLRD